MRYYRTTGLTLTQMQELVRRINEALDEPWNKRTGRPKSLRLYKAVEAACMYLRQNATQEFIGETRDTSQPTISRYAAVLVPLVKAVLEEFVPDAAEAIEIVRGRVVLVDGTLAPCWSYAEHPELWNGKHKTTGFNAQLISLLDGTAVWISGPRSPAIGYPQLCDVRLCPRWLVRNYQILVDSEHVSGACGDPGGHARAM